MGFRNQALNARQGRILTHGSDAYANGGVRGHGAGDNGGAGAFQDRARLARDQGLVELRLAAHDLAVGGNPTSRAHQYHVAGAELTHRHHFDLAVGTEALRLVGQQGGQVVQRPLGLAQGPHLQPVSEKHDRHQGRQLCPQIDAEKAKACERRSAEGHQQAHGDQQHHPRPAPACLRPSAGQEHGAAVEKDGSAEDRGHPTTSGEARGAPAGQLHEQVAVGNGGDGEDQAQPELLPEHGGVIAVSSMPGTSLVCHKRCMRLLLVHDLLLISISAHGWDVVSVGGLIGRSRCLPPG